MNQCIEILKDIVRDWNDYQDTGPNRSIAPGDGLNQFESKMHNNIEEAQRLIEESEVV